jgi:hypothetical protein
MIKKLKIMLLSIVGVATLATPVLAPALATAQSDVQNGLCQGADLQVQQPGTTCTETIDSETTTTKVNDIIALVINIFSVVVGVAAVIMIIVGGLKYIISGGDSGNVTSAKNTILYAIIGLVVVALAQFIVKFVLAKVTA